MKLSVWILSRLIKSIKWANSIGVTFIPSCAALYQSATFNSSNSKQNKLIKMIHNRHSLVISQALTEKHAIN